MASLWDAILVTRTVINNIRIIIWTFMFVVVTGCWFGTICAHNCASFRTILSGIVLVPLPIPWGKPWQYSIEQNYEYKQALQHIFPMLQLLKINSPEVIVITWNKIWNFFWRYNYALYQIFLLIVISCVVANEIVYFKVFFES